MARTDPSTKPTSITWRAELPDLVPVRMLNEFTYCPRLFYLAWVQGEFEDNADTVEGRFRHRRVDQEKGGADESPARPDEIHARSLYLSAEREGLVARIDVVEIRGRRAMPVDYKRGPVPDIPEKAWEPERVQLCAQGMILRENGYECDEGILYYVESRTRVRVPFTGELIARVRELVRQLKETAASGKLPPPLVDSPKCPRCSLVGICLPDEVNLLAAGNGRGQRGPVRRLIPERDDALPVCVRDQGAHVTKSGDVLVVRKEGETLDTIRLIDTSQLCVFGNVQVSTQAIRELASHGIPFYTSPTGAGFPP